MGDSIDVAEYQYFYNCAPREPMTQERSGEDAYSNRLLGTGFCPTNSDFGKTKIHHQRFSRG
jgi:hypothetical protein